MTDVTLRTLDGRETVLGPDAVARLRGSLRGELVFRDSSGYDEARRLWNGMADRRPGLIARCRSSADVVHAVRFAREHRLLTSVRGGGHNIAGLALADGSFAIDLSLMRGVYVDAARRTAWVDPGVTLGELDHDTQTFGFAVPTGINSTTGIAGLTLGGGYGWLARRFGLTVDNLLGAEVVTADGELLTANDSHNSDLFWALRGGGGNFGVVTSFQFRLHAVGPQVVAGLIVHPFEGASELLRRYRDVMASAPLELSAWVVVRQAPPLPFLDPAVHGQMVVVIATMYSGDPSDAERALAPLRAIGRPHADVVGPVPFVGFQQAFDPLLAPGARNYWKTRNFAQLSNPLIDTLVQRAARLPGPQCEIFLAHLGGAVSRKAEDATAYLGRQSPFVMNIHARWDDRAQDEVHVAWARDVFAATAPFAADGAYVNFLTADEGDRVRAAYGENYDRLAAIKAKFDPTNLFRVNQNILPREASQPRARVAPSASDTAPRP